MKIVVTGGGRVAGGAMEILNKVGLTRRSPEEYLKGTQPEAVYCQLNPPDYVKRIDGKAFDLAHFFNFPEEYETIFLPYTRESDILMACHFWDPRSPVFITSGDYCRPDFRIRVIADISCDVNGPLPSTLRASRIELPFYGYNPVTGGETPPFEPTSITVMAVDNLPGELPCDASEDFGNRLMEEVLPFLAGIRQGDRIEKATIAQNGRITDAFSYLNDWLAE
jgi:hypothetical protein